jgi:hypothetical protein
MVLSNLIAAGALAGCFSRVRICIGDCLENAPGTDRSGAVISAAATPAKPLP